MTMEAPKFAPSRSNFVQPQYGSETKSQLKNFCAFYAFLSDIEPKNVNETPADLDWVTAMQEELH